MRHEVSEIARHFQIPGTLQSAEPYGSGHINDTYRAMYEQDGTTVPYIYQRINHEVFTRPIPLMDNVHRVTSHQKQKLKEAGVPDLQRRVLTLIRSVSGEPYWQDDEGNVWRAYVFISEARTFDVPQSPAHAFEASRAFGAFQGQLVDLPGERLVETIPDFHNTPKRFDTFVRVVEADPENRAAQVAGEIDFILEREDVARSLLEMHAQGRLPERNVHNDTKVNNVMLDDRSGEAVCIVDLDTVMPGLVAYDFGDMVRTTVSPAEEDETDLSKIRIEMPLFRGLAEGYLESAHPFLTEEERATLVFGGKLITFEQAIRFLTDHLEGDTYYKIHRQGHNLDRCRTQVRLVECIADREEEMNAIIDSWHPASE